MDIVIAVSLSIIFIFFVVGNKDMWLFTKFIIFCVTAAVWIAVLHKLGVI